MSTSVESIFAAAESFRQLGMTQMYQNLDQARTFFYMARDKFKAGLDLKEDKPDTQQNKRRARAHLGATLRCLAPLEFEQDLEEHVDLKISVKETEALYKASVAHLLQAATGQANVTVAVLQENPNNGYPWAWAQLGQSLTWLGLYELYADNLGIDHSIKHFTDAQLAFDVAHKRNKDFALASAQEALLQFFWGLTIPALYPDDSKRAIQECGDRLRSASLKIGHAVNSLTGIQNWPWGLAWQSQINQVLAIFQRDFEKDQREDALNRALNSMNMYIESTLINPNLIPVVSLWSLICPNETKSPTAKINSAPLSRFLAAEELYMTGKFTRARKALFDIFGDMKKNQGGN